MSFNTSQSATHTDFTYEDYTESSRGYSFLRVRPTTLKQWEVFHYGHTSACLQLAAVVPTLVGREGIFQSSTTSLDLNLSGS